MLLIPFQYLHTRLSLPAIATNELAQKLTYYGLETIVITRGEEEYWQVNPLPNRTDLLSWQGIVQEIAILLNCQIKPSDFLPIPASQEKFVEVAIETTNCRAFSLGIIQNIQVQASSSLTQEWLKINNIQPVNNVVDMANLVMLESGQPLHVFDYDSLLEPKKIVIRQAHEGEKLTTIHGQILPLSPKDLVISSGGKFIDLAGIIGAQETAITPQTKNILLECANFSSSTIQKTTGRLNVITSASRYFCQESSLISSVSAILQRVITLIINSSSGKLTSGTFFTHQEAKETKKTVAISQDFIEQKIGQEFPESTIEEIWKRLNFPYQKQVKIYYLLIPTYRQDINNCEDLLEELLRIYDYNKIKSSLPSEINSLFLVSNKLVREKQKIRAHLVSCGWQEIITYSLVSVEMKEERVIEKKNNFYQLLTPKIEYHSYYRQTLIPSHLKTIADNLSRKNKNLLFFEISSVYAISQQEELLILSGTGKIFNQPFHGLTRTIDFYWIKGLLENIFSYWQLEPEITCSPITSNLLISSQSAEIFLAKEPIGFCGQISSTITKKYQINEPIFIGEISLTKVFAYLQNFPHKNFYKPSSNFPLSEKDLSFIFSQEIDYKKVSKVIKKVGGEELIEISMFDVYQNAEMEKNAQKSVSFHLVFQSSTKTLESKEIEEIIKNIAEEIEGLFKAKLRR